MGVVGCTRGGDEGMATDGAKNKDVLPLDAMSKLSLNDDGQHNGAASVVFKQTGGRSLDSQKGVSYNKENSPPQDLSMSSGIDDGAEVNGSVRPGPPKISSGRGASDSRPVEVILTGLSLNKVPLRVCDRAPDIQPWSERLPAPGPRAVSKVDEASDNSRHKDDGYARAGVCISTGVKVCDVTRDEANSSLRAEVGGGSRSEICDFSRDINGDARVEIKDNARTEINGSARAEINTDAGDEINAGSNVINTDAGIKLNSIARTDIGGSARAEISVNLGTGMGANAGDKISADSEVINADAGTKINSLARADINESARAEISANTGTEINSRARAHISGSTRADNIGSTRADIIGSTRAAIIGSSRADIIGSTRADIIGGTRADIIGGTRAEISANQGTEINTDAGTKINSLARADINESARAEIIGSTRAEIIDSTRTDIIGSTRAEISANQGTEINTDAGTKLNSLARADINESARAEIIGSTRANQGTEIYGSPRAELNGCVGVGPPRAYAVGGSSNNSFKFTGLTIGQPPWRKCSQPPKTKPTSLTRAQESDEEDWDERFRRDVGDIEDDEAPQVLRGPIMSNHLSKQRCAPYWQPPSPWSGSDATSSPGPSSDMSQSPVHRSDSSQTLSPTGRSDNSQSPSPAGLSDSSQSPSPEPSLVLNVPCMQPHFHAGGFYSVNQEARSPALASSLSPPVETESTAKTRRFMAGCSILPGDPKPEQQPGSRVPVVEPPLTMDAMANLLSISPRADGASAFPGRRREPEDSPLSIASSGSPLTECSYELSPQMVSSPEEGSELDAAIAEVFSDMAPYTAQAAAVQPMPDLDGGLDQETLDMMQCYLVDDLTIDLPNCGTVTDLDTEGLLATFVDHGLVPDAPATSRDHCQTLAPGGTSVSQVPASTQNGFLEPFGTVFNPPGVRQLSLTFVVPKAEAAQACTSRARAPPPVTVVISRPESVPQIPLGSLPLVNAGARSRPAPRLAATVESKIEQNLKKFTPILPRPTTGDINSPRRGNETSTRGANLIPRTPKFSSAPVQIPMTSSSGNLVGAVSPVAHSPRVLPVYGDQYLILTADEDGDTNLHIAVANNNVGLTRAIVERNGNHRSCIDVRNRQGQTPLFMAVFVNNAELTKYLLQNGAEPNPVCKNGTTPLHLLAMRGQEFLEVAKILCQVRDIPMNNRNNRGFTALHVAVQYHSQSQSMIPFISMLLRHGADLSFEEMCDRKTALHMAVERGLPEMVSAICSSCSNISAAINFSSFKGTALHYAAMLNHVAEAIQTEIVETLLRYGASPSLRSAYLGNKCPKDLVCNERKKVKDMLRFSRK